MSSMLKLNKEIQIRENGSVRVLTVNTLPSRTQQQFKEQCDVNNIIAKYKHTGEFVHLTRRAGVYADVSSITDYHQSMQKVLDAQAAFQTLPSSVRNRFQNDPAQLLAFMQDPNNHAEGISLGIFEKPTPKPPSENPTVTKPNEPNEPKPKVGKSHTQPTNPE